MVHLEKFGFKLEDTSLEFKYSVEFSTNKKKLIRKMSMGKATTKKLFMGESNLWSFTTNIRESKNLIEHLCLNTFGMMI